MPFPKSLNICFQKIKILDAIQTNIYSLLFFPFEAANPNEGHHYNVSPLSDTLGEKSCLHTLQHKYFRSTLHAEENWPLKQQSIYEHYNFPDT